LEVRGNTLQETKVIVCRFSPLTPSPLPRSTGGEGLRITPASS
jgi:hypothetical protein